MTKKLKTPALKPATNHPLVYLISNRLAFRLRPEDDAARAGELQIEAIRRAAQAGCPLIQIREKDLCPRELCDFTRKAIDAARPSGARVLLNDRLDAALASGADGIHLRTDSLPAAEVKAVISGKGLRNFLIAASTHSIDQAREAEAGGADFIVCGPVYETPSKQGFGPPLGLEKFERVCRSVKIPVLALGGIDLSNFREPLKRGAAGIAAIGLFSNPQTDLEKVLELLTSIKHCS